MRNIYNFFCRHIIPQIDSAIPAPINHHIILNKFDESFALDCYKGRQIQKAAGHRARKHGAKALKRGISNEYVAICTGIQCDGRAIAATVNRAKPSSEELKEVFRGHIAENTMVLTNGLCSYHIFETFAKCMVVDVNQEGGRGLFNLNTVSSLHSYIKETYNHYRGVATKYINRYNTLFSNAFRCASNLEETLFLSLCLVGRNSYWHSVNDVRNYHLVTL